MASDQLLLEYPVADIALPDLLSVVRAALDDVVRNGGTFANWKAMVLPEMKRVGWWGEVRNRELTGTDDAVLVDAARLELIYRSNMRIALASIHWNRIQRQKDVLPCLRSIGMSAYRDDNSGCICGVPTGIILPVDHTYWMTAFPPNAPGCQCHFEQVSDRRMRIKGWAVTPDSEVPSTAGIAEDYRCNFGVKFPIDWQPTLMTF